MRELKFRVWHKPTGVMHDYLKAKFGPKGVNITLSGKFKDVEEPTTLTVPNKDLEVMQFTGLRDKNGKEIYEGDILRVGVIENIKQNREVVWENGAFFTLVPEDKKLTSRDHLVAYYSIEEMEVIGNICENPEFLK
jgi:uncharacterized phage protein (TIGR01671 family)